MSVTLLQKGKIVIPKNTNDIERIRISNLSAVDYIMEWYNARVPSHKGGKPHIEPRGMHDRVLVVKAGTGTGKSTTLGPELYARYTGDGLGAGRSIAITQPRVLTAIDIPNKIVKIPNMSFLKFGKNIGYQTGVFINKPIKGIVFMTIGVIAQQLISMDNDAFINKYSFIIFDECHDRTMELDLAMYRIKNFIKKNYKNAKCPFLILTSATFDAMKYAKYFECGEDNIIEVLGYTQPIAEHYPMISCSNLSDGIINSIKNIHFDNQYDYTSDLGRDIIVFVAKVKWATAIVALIEKYNDHIREVGRFDYIVPITLTSDTYNKQGVDYLNIYTEYKDIFIEVGDEKKRVNPMRRVIIATPVAETGVTIDSLKYCIDTGYVLSPEWNPIYGATVLAEKPVTQNMAMQRKGRVGRSFPGEWHPLFTRDIFGKLINNTMPDIIIKNIDTLMLSIVIEQSIPDWDKLTNVDHSEMTGSFDIRKIDLLDPIPYDSVANSLQRLYALGMITHEYKPTAMGLCAIKFTHVPIESICMILYGYVHGANVLALITIASFMMSSKLFSRGYTRRNIFKSDNPVRDMFKTRLFIGCDFIDYLFIYEELCELLTSSEYVVPMGIIEKWCIDNNINVDEINDIIAMRDSLINTIISIGLNPYRNTPLYKKGLELKYKLSKHILDDFDGGIDEVKKIKRCIYDGFKMNIATFNLIVKSYVSDANGLKLNPSSDLLKPLGFDDTESQNVPIKILYGKPIISKNTKTNVFALDASCITVLDGFLIIDDDFIIS